MSDGAPALTGAGDVGALVRQTIRGMIRGDRELRAESLSRALAAGGGDGSGGGVPQILVARRMQGRVGIVVERTASSSFAFGLFREDRTHTVADVRFAFGIEPSPETVAGARAPLAFAFRAPAFLDPGPGDGAFALSLPNGRRATVAVSEKGVVRLTMDDGAEAGGSSWPVPVAIRLLEMLRRWAGDGAVRDAAPFAFDPGSELGALVAEVAASVDGVRVAVAAASAEADTADDALPASLRSADFGGGYALSTSRAQVLVQVDGAGRLIGDDDRTEWQQYDAVLDGSAAHPGEVELRIALTDFLVAGPFHDRFAQAFRAHAAEMAAQLDARIGGTRAACVALLQGGGLSGAAFARIAADPDGTDRDLVFVRGDLGGEPATLLWTATCKVTRFPQVRVTSVGDVALEAARVGTYAWRLRFDDDAGGDDEGEGEIARYLERILRILGGWHRGLVRGAARAHG